MSREELVENGEDPTDMGGYFIINGIERVLILSEDIASNKMIFQKKGNAFVARLDSKSQGYTQRHAFERKEDGMVVVRFANLTKTPVPLVILMRALGIETDKEIIEAVSKDGADSEPVYLQLLMTEITSKAEAIDYIGRVMKITQKDQLNPVLCIYLTIIFCPT